MIEYAKISGEYFYYVSLIKKNIVNNVFFRARAPQYKKRENSNEWRQILYHSWYHNNVHNVYISHFASF